MKTLVTGATGFLGGAVARVLMRAGISVVATGRNARAGELLAHEGITFQPCDLATDATILQRFVEGCDTVVHSAALTSPWGRRAEFIAANVTATENVLTACRAAGVKRVVHISSPSVTFDFKDQPHHREDTPWSDVPANEYVETKRLAETLVRDAAARGEIEAIILRPKALFGPGDTTLLPRIIRVARRRTFPIFGDRDPLMDLTWIDDAAHAVLLALRASSSCSGRVYHITSGDPQPRSRILNSLLDACGIPVQYRIITLQRALTVVGWLERFSRIFTLSRWEPPATRYSVGALAFDQSLDISAARAQLGYDPHTDVLARLRECGLAWRKEHSTS